LQIVRANSCRVTPWKNGGGSTTEIAASPSGASLETFDWRISMARVASDGPFSEFPDIDRTLTIVSGHGLTLTIGRAAPVILDRASDPLSFAGDIPTSARLTAGEIVDLNVMTRRHRYHHEVRRVRQQASYRNDGSDVAAVLSFNGSTIFTLTQDVVTLNHGDAVILTSTDHPSMQIAPSNDSDCFLVLLRKRDTR
jgi:hypothetical protein